MVHAPIMNLTVGAPLWNGALQKQLVFISLIGDDPYKIPKGNFSNSHDVLPAVTYPDIYNYLVASPSPYSKEDLKAYKSLEAYNQFVCGWVRDIVSLEQNAPVDKTALRTIFFCAA